MSTYIAAICAGPYHEVRDEHDGISLGAFCRASMAQHLDHQDLFLITKQGFDFFHQQFGMRYPLPKYDQLWVPDFNAGAMENFGCVTHAEAHYLFRSQVTDFEYEQRANTILHELAHMWFGDLVTMRWWNDLWLNESFAEWASHWCNSAATRFSDAWTTFLSVRKSWGYRQDQLSSTHPIYCEMPDLEAVEVNFDGITYAKGAGVIKQLVAYVGQEAFITGLRAYFQRHAWGNATFDDLLVELEAASGRELRKFAAQWLETAQVNTLRPLVEIGPDGNYTSVVVQQEAPAAYPTLRTHRIGIGLYDLRGRPPRPAQPARAGRGRRADRGGRARRSAGRRRAAAQRRRPVLHQAAPGRALDGHRGQPHRRPRLLAVPGAVLERRVGHGARRRTGRPRLRHAGLLGPAGRPTSTSPPGRSGRRRARSRSTPTRSGRRPAGPSWPNGPHPAGRRRAGQRLAAQLGPLVHRVARTPEEQAVLRGWLTGSGVPKGLVVDTELRWLLLQTLSSLGAATRTRSRTSWPATAPPAASGRPRRPGRSSPPRRTRPACGPS